MVEPATDEMALKLGHALRARRKAQRISMTAAAEAAGMSRVTWHRLEKGETGVAWGFALAAASALGLGMDWVVDDDGSPSTRVCAPTPSLDDWMPLTIRLDDFPGLRRLAWQVRDGLDTLTPREAWELYERNGRHLDMENLSVDEEALMRTLRKVYGGIHANI